MVNSKKELTMLLFRGHLVHIFPSKDMKDEQTGEITKSKPILQLLVKILNDKGVYKSHLIWITIPIEKLALYQDKVTQIIEVEVESDSDVEFYSI